MILNLNNKTDISFGIYTLRGIPVFLTAFSSFVLGMLYAVPFIMRFKKMQKTVDDETDQREGESKQMRRREKKSSREKNRSE
jgi:hypothetical protein